jgi:hypothetical protein
MRRRSAAGPRCRRPAPCAGTTPRDRWSRPRRCGCRHRCRRRSPVNPRRARGACPLCRRSRWRRPVARGIARHRADRAQRRLVERSSGVAPLSACACRSFSASNCCRRSGVMKCHCQPKPIRLCRAKLSAPSPTRNTCAESSSMRARELHRIPDVTHLGYGAGAQVGAIHDGGIQFGCAVGAQHRAAAGVEQRIVLQHRDRRLHRVQGAAVVPAGAGRRPAPAPGRADRRLRAQRVKGSRGRSPAPPWIARAYMSV